MAKTYLLTSLAAFVVVQAGIVSGQGTKASVTPWGEPDIQGTWTAEAELSVPFERPREYGTRQVLTDAEFKQRQSQSDRQLQSDNSDFDLETADRSTAGDVPNDLLDRRDQLLDDLSEFGQISVTDNPDGTVDVSFVDKVTTGATYPVVTGSNSTWAGPPAGNAWVPGGRLGGLLEASRPGGTLDEYISDLNSIATNLANAVNAIYPGGDFFQVGAPPAGAADTLKLNPALATNPSLVVGGTGAEGSSDVARAIAAIQNDPASGVDGAYQAFVAKVGSQVREAIRQEANAQVLTDAVENRRQSVSGVSMDEEMSNLVRFQRSYQASSRAMSTMDEMLDVLINRTGRVGL